MPTQVRPQPVKEDRDPNHINDHLKIKFNDVLGEPDGIHTFDIVWEFSETFYSCCRDLWYGLATCLCGLWIAMYWGVVFGVVAFHHIWALSPLRISCEMIMSCFRFLKPVANCCIEPWTGACAHLFVGFAEPGTDSSKWGYPDIKTPVKHILSKKDSPVPVKRAVKEDKRPPNENLFLGQTERMAQSVKRQMLL